MGKETTEDYCGSYRAAGMEITMNHDKSRVVQ